MVLATLALPKLTTLAIRITLHHAVFTVRPRDHKTRSAIETWRDVFLAFAAVVGAVAFGEWGVCGG